MCLWLAVLLSEVNHLGLEDGSIFLWTPERPKEMRDESGLPAAFRVLSSLSRVFKASPLPLLIKLLEQWLLIAWLSEASREWRWGQEQKRWTWISGRESGLSHSASELLAAALPGFRVAPALVPTHQPANCPLPQGPQVDLNGGGRAMEGGGVAASKSQTFPVSSCYSPPPPCVPSDTTSFSPSLMLRALWRARLHPPPLPPATPQHLPIQAFMLHLSLLLGDKAHPTALGLNLMCNHVMHLPVGSFGSCP